MCSVCVVKCVCEYVCVYEYTGMHNDFSSKLLPKEKKKKYFLATCQFLLFCYWRDRGIRSHTQSSFNQKQSSCSNMDFCACQVPKHAKSWLAASLQRACGAGYAALPSFIPQLALVCSQVRTSACCRDKALVDYLEDSVLLELSVNVKIVSF